MRNDVNTFIFRAAKFSRDAKRVSRPKSYRVARGDAQER
jgi:hypothetical protein